MIKPKKIISEAYKDINKSLKHSEKVRKANKKITLLEECRKSLGIDSKRKMAKAIGISYVGYCKYEQRKVKPSLAVFSKITKFMDRSKVYVKFCMNNLELHEMLMVDFLRK